jgi:tetratricopeptide (TPR) repeat protein
LRSVISIALLTSLAFASSAPGRSIANERATSLYNRTAYSEAVAVLNQSSPDAGNLELFGQCYFMMGDFKKATGMLERAAALAPDDSMIQTWLGRALGRRAETAFAFKALGYAAKTREAFERAVYLDAGNSEALGDLFDFYMDAPEMIGGGIGKAESLLPQFSRYDPVGGYIAQARIEEKRKQVGSAEASLRRAIEAAPQKVGPVLNLAQFLSRIGRFEESEEVFRHAAAIASDSPRILFARADSYIKARRKTDQARDLLKKYLAANNLTPDDPPRWEALRLLKKAEGG